MNLSASPLLFLLLLSVAGCGNSAYSTGSQADSTKKTASNSDVELTSLIAEADRYLQQAPVPLTNFRSERSAGGPNDFYSEGDYWWPDPANPNGPYIRRDGNTNPENFVAHRIAMRDLSRWVSTLVAAYKATGEKKYAEHALAHLNAFFLNPATRMNPNLLHAQAIQGRHTGRGIGIIDTIHLIEVAQAIQKLIDMGFLPKPKEVGLKTWFNEYATWMTTHHFMLPAIQDKSNWTYPPDIQNFDEVPIQTLGLLFAAQAYKDSEMLSTWKGLSPERKSKEVDRNFPLRQPSLW